MSLWRMNRSFLWLEAWLLIGEKEIEGRLPTCWLT